jgi:hypothetical protein
MENKNQLSIGGRVALSGYCEGRIETTNNIQAKYILNCVGLDTCTALNAVRCKCTANEHRLLDQRITHL